MLCYCLVNLIFVFIELFVLCTATEARLWSILPLLCQIEPCCLELNRWCLRLDIIVIRPKPKMCRVLEQPFIAHPHKQRDLLRFWRCVTVSWTKELFYQDIFLSFKNVTQQRNKLFMVHFWNRSKLDWLRVRPKKPANHLVQYESKNGADARCFCLLSMCSGSATFCVYPLSS